MVFLVDDDSDDLEIIHEALVKNSYTGAVRTAENGQVLMKELAAYGRTQKPDVIILDLNMPLKNGFQVLSEIRSNPELNTIPVAILTASSNHEDEIRCLKLGCTFFFRKPHTLHEYNSIALIVIDFLRKKLSGAN